MLKRIFNLNNLVYLFIIVLAWWVTASLVQPFIHYNFQQIAFVKGFDFLNNYTNYAGGISDYVAEFVSQYFSFNIFGSFIIVLIATVQAVLVVSLFGKLSHNNKFKITIFSIIILLSVVLMCDYRYPYYASIRLLFSFISIAFFYILNKRFPSLSVYFWFVFACLVFYITGAAATVVFGLSTAAIYWLTNKQRSKYYLAISFVFFVAILPYIGYRIFFLISLENIYSITFTRPPYMLDYKPQVWLYLYYLLLPILLWSVIVVKAISFKPFLISSKKKNENSKKQLSRNPLLTVSIQLVCCLIAGYYLFIKLYNPQKKYQLLVEYYAENEKWREVLKTISKIDEYDFRINFQVNRAFAHTGVLGERLNEYPQLLGEYGLFIDGTMAGSVAMPTSDLFWDLGLMSESQHWAFEAQTLLPNSPRILKRLVMINLVNRKYHLAEKFLTVLDKNYLYHDWVTERSRFVNDTMLTNSDSEIVQKRQFNPQFPVVFTRNSQTLEMLFQWNPKNRMAYEYLLTHSILSYNIKQFVSYLPFYKNFDYKKMPRTWEEVTALYIAKQKTLPVNIKPEMLSKETIQQFQGFSTIIRKNNNDIKKSKYLLKTNYPNTYWYYTLYLSPKVTNSLSNKIQVQ